MTDDSSQDHPGADVPNRTPSTSTPAAPGAWQRILDQKTVPQRLLLALAAVVTSLAAIAGGIYALGQALRDGEDTPTSSLQGRSQGHTVVQQQSPEADQFVRDLIASAQDRGTIRLDHRVYEQAGRAIFTDSDLRLVYNCRPTTSCDFVRLQFPNGHDNRPRVVEDDKAALFVGQYSVKLGNGVEFGDEFLDIVFVFLGA